MSQCPSTPPRRRLLPLALPLAALWPLAASADEACEPEGDYAFVCGLKNAEDLVKVPGTRWLIASGMAAGGVIYGIDTGRKSYLELYPGDAPHMQHDRQRYGACPGAPDPAQLVSHGLNLQPGADGHAKLYVVGHGGREAIEVFDVDASGAAPVLTWTGCVPTPDGMEANSVASLADGGLLVTIPLHTGRTINEALAGQTTGQVYHWSPGEDGLRPVAGTGMPYANGIETSPDGQVFYVASSGLFNVTAFSNTDPARVLQRTEPLVFVPDNLHRDDHGRLVTAGLNIDDPNCGGVERTEEFSLEEFAACPRAWTAWSIDPQTMQGEAIATGPANPRFSNITMAVEVGGELWVGTFAGDRVAWRPIAPRTAR